MRLLGELLVERVTLAGGETLVGRPASPTYARFCEFFQSLDDAEKAEELTVVAAKDGTLELQAGTLTIGVEKFQFRSLFSAMFLASRNVETPEPQKGWAKPAVGASEIAIRASKTPPTNALVSVQYAGWHYSIANDDIRSKDTLALFMQLSRIQAGPMAPAPLVTIPAR